MRAFFTKPITLPLWALVLIALVALGLGGAGGASDTGEKEEPAVDSGQMAAAEQRAERAEAELAEARAAVGEAKAAAEAALAEQKAGLDVRAAELDEREKAVGIQEKAAEENSFGSGVHRVGVDIKPGRYRVEHSGRCYWAKLRENDDIIDNELFSEPGVANVTIEPSVYKFESTGCGTWRRVA